MSLTGILSRSQCTGPSSTVAFAAGLRSASRSYSTSTCQTDFRGVKQSRRPTIATPSPVTDLRDLEKVFYQALARAGCCRQHAQHYIVPALQLHRKSPGRPKTRDESPSKSRRSAFSTNGKNKQTANAVAVTEPSRDELRSLVETYDPYAGGFFESGIDSIDAPPPTIEVNTRRQEDESKDNGDPGPAKIRARQRQFHRALTLDAEDEPTLQSLIRLLDDPNASHDAVFALYQQLPSPRITYLSSSTIYKLLRHLSAVEIKNEKSMLRYFALMDDMVTANVPLEVWEWNSAIAFAGRWTRHVKLAQVTSAMKIWVRMEKEAGVRADEVTFNILFDVATKANKFALAEVVLNEMESRGLEHTRFLRTGKIYFHGIKRDGEAVRRSYREIVDAGEIIDTAILNCVISALIRAGEPSAAEDVFERMKQLSEEKTRAKRAPTDWRGRRHLAKLLDNAARSLRLNPAGRTPIQDTTPIAPDLHTYRILISHHAAESGNMDRITELLTELHSTGLPLHGTLFYHIFHGFDMHGGVRYSLWTKTRLDRLWVVFLEQVAKYAEINDNPTEEVSDDERGCYIDRGIVIAALMAYEKCAGSAVVAEVWGEIQERWTPSKEDLEEINGLLIRLKVPLWDSDAFP